MKTKFTGILFLFLALTGCVKETLDKCPEGNVKINLYAEKFQTNSAGATEDKEDVFNKRIQYLHCILYKDNTYVLDTVIPDLSEAGGDAYTLFFPKLEFGDYQLVTIGNSTPDAMSGDLHIPGDLTLLYLGADQTEDLFASALNFTVDCDCVQEFSTKLRRLLGVVRCRISNIPDNATEAEVIIHGANSKLGKESTYSQATDVSRRVTVERTDGNKTKDLDIILGTFPTSPQQPASYELKLYSAGNTTLFDQVMTTDVHIVRNQLIELVTDFSDGNFRFEIIVNGKWEDYINGGEVEIH